MRPDPSIPPDSAVHTDPEVARRCPYCHPWRVQGVPATRPLAGAGLPLTAEEVRELEAARLRAEEMRSAYQSQVDRLLSGEFRSLLSLPPLKRRD